MAGLVSYASSDDDESADKQPQLQAPASSNQAQQPSQRSQPLQPTAAAPPKLAAAPPPKPAQPPQDTPAPGAALPPPGAALPPPDAALLGPSLPPMGPLSSSSPSSPYTTSRSLIHDLTLPSIPCLSIPSSPPDSPPLAAAATSQKFAHFLALKKKGTHFNAKLQQSSALRNPALTDKLLQFVDVPPPSGGHGGRLQYQTTLSADVWDPEAFPAWAFRDGLKKGRDKVAKEKEAQRAAPGRTSVEFVSAAGAPAGGGKGEKRKGAWQ